MFSVKLGWSHDLDLGVVAWLLVAWLPVVVLAYGFAASPTRVFFYYYYFYVCVERVFC